jgi:hypothetical protein
MKAVYRGVEFAVNSADGVEWTWDVYPKRAKVDGKPLHGNVKGTEADAMKACIAAIDKAWAENSN